MPGFNVAETMLSLVRLVNFAEQPQLSGMHKQQHSSLAQALGRHWWPGVSIHNCQGSGSDRPALETDCQ
jgi:hypothetical protein